MRTPYMYSHGSRGSVSHCHNQIKAGGGARTGSVWSPCPESQVQEEGRGWGVMVGTRVAYLHINIMLMHLI